MKYFNQNSVILLFLLFVIYASCPAQGQPLKRQLTEQDYNKWGMIKPGPISQDGKWVSWSVHYDEGQDTLFVAASSGRKCYKFAAGRQGKFLGNEIFYFQNTGKNSCLIELTSGKHHNIGQTGKTAVWESYLVAANPEFKNIEVWNNEGSKLKEIKDIKQFCVSSTGQTFVYITHTNEKSLLHLSLLNSKKKISESEISLGEYQNLTISKPIWSEDNKSVSFYSKTERDTTVFYFDINANELRQLNNSHLSNEMKIDFDGNLSLTPRGEVLATIRDAALPSIETPIVEVWNTLDKVIYPKALETHNWKYAPKTLLWNPKTGKIQQLTTTDYPQAALVPGGKYALLWNTDHYEPQFEWVSNIDLYLLNVETGEKKILLKNQQNSSMSWQISPDGKYLTYFTQGHWYNYNFSKGIHAKLSHNFLAGSDTPSSKVAPNAPVLWTKDGRSILLCDDFDIWLVSADGGYTKRLTNGREHNIILRIPQQHAVSPLKPIINGWGSSSVDMTKDIVLEARAPDYSKTGYYLLKKNGVLETIVFDQSRNYNLAQAGKTISWYSERYDSPTAIRCRRGKGPIVDVTQNQKSIAEFYWGESKRISYQWKNHSLGGILYYPADFRKGKKYPMVVHVYEKQSQRLHYFIRPSLYDGEGFNVTNLTNKGYFVFLPDIAYQLGSPGDSALNCTQAGVIAAITDEAGIDAARLGLIGYSFGGYEASFIATKSTMFKAIAAGAGVTDFASSYFSLAENYNIPEYFRFETFQMRMGKPFHENIQGYIENSPVYQAAGVKTPILIYTGGKDKQIRHNQSREFYFALRRLGKPSILLVYPEEDHAFEDRKTIMDLTHKIEIFFGHYLKGLEKKDWMEPNF
ncbi:prolyl oligopeptidase family serine peptidase [Flavobacterium piscis]|uniref:Dipeptidyl aminopeptidase/acylaminoacyl peptidase n=1 Tax=Flavobacterium piscis TaxID=1114874 RepID=A0ABU1Y3M6_9FLAO|nr:prolyl oligopeptidase family serine peptidase [Flavobacterium piscis]MDR7208830.1 dipeptidyl aminopeptidase/acylaminoacyl peptidase [Flavobacterium piscis]